MNAVFLAKCEFAASHYAEAMRWLNDAEDLLYNRTSASSVIIQDSSDTNGEDANPPSPTPPFLIGDAAVEIPALIAEVETLKPRYRAYLRD